MKASSRNSLAALALSLCAASTLACSGASTSNDPSAAMALAVHDGRAALLDQRGQEVAHLDVPGLADGYSVRHHARGSVVVVGGNDRVWELTVSPKLAARPVGTVTLPADQRACLEAAEGDPVAGFMQSGYSVDISAAAADRVCLTFSDRNENMMDVEITATLNLTDGAVTSGVTFAADDRFEPGACRVAEKCCETGKQVPAAPGKWDMKDGCTLVNADTKAVIDLRPLLKLAPTATPDDCDGNGASLRGQSETGRFLGLIHDMSEGDYMHFTLTLFDTATGTATPKAVRSFDVVGETRVAWARSSDAVLIADELVILGSPLQVIPVGAAAQFLE